MKRPFQILGTSKYLPANIVRSEELDERLGLEPGTAFNRSGVRERRFTLDESVSEMGAKAARLALEEAGLKFTDMDALVYVGATKEQMIPCNAIFIQKALGEGRSGVACFDIDATCLGFLVGLDQMTLSIAGARFDRVLLVSSEIASRHLNPARTETATLFGDGAAAWVLSRADGVAQPSTILAAHMESHSEYTDVCGILGGASRLPAFEYSAERHEDFCFNMEGRRLFKVTAQLTPLLIDRIYTKSGLTLPEIEWVIPHQASESALCLMRKRLGVAEERWIKIIADHGNQISASMPTAFHELKQSGRLKKGDRVLFLGTGAGLSLAFLLLQY